jgi:hypothetical protein
MIVVGEGHVRPVGVHHRDMQPQREVTLELLKNEESRSVAFFRHARCRAQRCRTGD